MKLQKEYHLFRTCEDSNNNELIIFFYIIENIEEEYIYV